MDLENFLARVVPAAGNYLILTWPSNTGRGFGSRTYTLPNEIGLAANFARWLATKNTDVYFALAAFTAAEVRKGRDDKEHHHARREQANVQLLRVLVMDADVARPGDGKDPAKVFADRRAAATWLAGFLAQTKLPPPNMRVNSGYGMHWYWILEDAVTPVMWQPLANALKAAMLAHGWVGDTSPTIDSARILRPAQTVNMKAGTPVPVEVYTKSLRGDYPNQMIVDALTPWIAVAAQGTGTHGAGGTASIHTLGPRPGHVPPGQGAGLNQAAHQGIAQRAFSFKLIATKCAQVGMSLAANGKGDDYHLWYKGNLTLTQYCADGADYVHPIGNGDPRYTPADTEAAIARIQQEIARKSLGAPKCTSYDGYRPGVCQSCPWHNKLISPLSLGADDDTLPEGYRRLYTGTDQACIERFVVSKDKDDDGEWRLMARGNMYGPRVDELAAGGHQLTFTYEWGGKTFSVAVRDRDTGDARVLAQSFADQGMTLYASDVPSMGRFVVAWINQLRAAHAQRQDILKPFGWNFDVAGQRLGFAIAGDHYRSDKTLEHVPGGDPKIAALYRPMGDFAEWRSAAALFEHGRVDLQALIATSFASPLIGLSGDVKGMTMNFWSTESGIGKTSAIRLGQSVWGDPRAMSSMTDTPNAVMKSLSELRVLTRFWDELRVVPSWQERFVEMIFVIPQGRERARMQSDTTLREVGEWESFLTFTANRSMADLVVENNQGTDSGLQRLFEIRMLKVQTAYDPAVGPIIKKLETNYGHAGRVYAKWLGENHDEAINKLTAFIRSASNDLSMQQEERFFCVAIGCIMVGASIARKLKLFDFELDKIYTVLKDNFLAMRAGRTGKTLVMPNGGIDLEELIGRYVTEFGDYRIRTPSFKAQGGGNVDVLARPRGEAVRFQIAEGPGVLRIAKDHLTRWLGERRLPADTVLEQMFRELGASKGRKTLAGGTKYLVGQTWCIDIPLVGPLSSHLNPDAPGTVGRRAPGAGLAGTP